MNVFAQSVEYIARVSQPHISFTNFIIS